jgi:hypothetical protein
MIGDTYIEEINQVFDTNAEFHSVFVHTDDQTNQALETSGTISGKGVISAVYTLPMEDTNSMYEKVSAILIPKIIRDGGGFYDVAKKLSFDENAKMTFSIIPLDSKSLLQLKLFLQIKEIKRSDYFSAGFYPLNSIIQVVILSPESINISDIKGDIVPTQIIDNEKIPIDIKKQGWIFDPQAGERIQGKYIFGEETSVSSDKLKFSLEGKNIEIKKAADIPIVDESMVVVVIITIVAIAAALFYLKGYKK